MPADRTAYKNPRRNDETMNYLLQFAKKQQASRKKAYSSSFRMCWDRLMLNPEGETIMQAPEEPISCTEAFLFIILKTV